MEAFDELDLNHILYAVQCRMANLKDAMYEDRKLHPYKAKEWREKDDEWVSLQVIEHRILKMLAD